MRPECGLQMQIDFYFEREHSPSLADVYIQILNSSALNFVGVVEAEGSQRWKEMAPGAVVIFAYEGERLPFVQFYDIKLRAS